MTSFEISLITLGFLVAGVLLGMGLQFPLPDHHLSPGAENTIKLGTGIVATMSALILGLLISSSKNSFDAVNSSIARDGAKVIELDYLLAGYGPETMPLRKKIKQTITARVQKLWPAKSGTDMSMDEMDKSTALLDLQRDIAEYSPRTPAQKSIIDRAQIISSELWQSRLLLIEQQQEPVPVVFVTLLVFWLTLLFLCIGLFAPRNLTVFSILTICALAISSAIFLILEMSHPLQGFIKVSNAPVLKALELMGR